MSICTMLTWKNPLHMDIYVRFFGWEKKKNDVNLEEFSFNLANVIFVDNLESIFASFIDSVNHFEVAER